MPALLHGEAQIADLLLQRSVLLLVSVEDLYLLDLPKDPAKPADGE